MILKIFSIYDNKAHAFTTPFFMHRHEMALRTFNDCAGEEGHAFFKNPADYTLFEVGEWDDDTAVVTNFEQSINHGIPNKINTPPDAVNLVRAQA